MKVIDLDEQYLNDHYPQVLSILLCDRTTGRNITWSCDDYTDVCADFSFDAEIIPESITGVFSGLIKPRSQKAKEDQLRRTKGQAEVFTPTWVCNAQNNLIDEAWFGRSDVFNTTDGRSWEAVRDAIPFPEDMSKTWQSYVSELRLEVTCGEAPYLVSRYDTVTGEPIKLSDRIGILDRKMRVLNENCTTSDEWLFWAQRAVKSTYGFEYQGDSLLLARENILLTYQDYREAAIGTTADRQELEEIATIISWNIWQMDGLTQCPPTRNAAPPANEPVQLELFSFDTEPVVTSLPCVIMDWNSDTPVQFSSLMKN